MNISLVIPAYNEEGYIGACLEHVQKNGAGLYEVIVIDNASTDNTAEVVQRFSGGSLPIRVVKESRKGLTKARQRGLSEMKGDILAFIDADTQMPAGWVAQVQREFARDSRLVCLSGPYRYYDASFLSAVGNWIYWVFLAWPTYMVTGYMAVGGNFIARKSALEAIGGFDESISFYGEDTDIARRLAGVGKVKFLQSLYMPTSARRLQGEGVLVTAYRYVINFFSIVFRGKPHTSEYRDIR